MEREKFAVPGCKQTTASVLFQHGGFQFLNVEVEPGGEVPLHTHECAATMIITEGLARKLGQNDCIVRKGEVVVKAPNEPHGFSEVQEPFSFISVSNDGGIMQEHGWNMSFAS